MNHIRRDFFYDWISPHNGIHGRNLCHIISRLSLVSIREYHVLNELGFFKKQQKLHSKHISPNPRQSSLLCFHMITAHCASPQPLKYQWSEYLHIRHSYSDNSKLSRQTSQQGAGKHDLSWWPHCTTLPVHVSFPASLLTSGSTDNLPGHQHTHTHSGGKIYGEITRSFKGDSLIKICFQNAYLA